MNQLENIKKYWNKRAEGYAKSISEEFLEQENIWKNRFKKLLCGQKTGRALDLGCGPGMFTMLLTDMEYDVTAFDYSDEMLKQAKKALEERGHHANFVQGDAQQLPFEDNYFDLIVTRNLTWNLENPEKAYSEWIRVLKKGGILLNFDGNYYYHYYNKNYQIARDMEDIKSGSGHKYMEDVDVSIIDNIAKDLPLSKKERPAWDLVQLLSYHVHSCETEIEWHSFKDKKGEKHQVAHDFMIKVEK